MLKEIKKLYCRHLSAVPAALMVLIMLISSPVILAQTTGTAAQAEMDWKSYTETAFILLAVSIAVILWLVIVTANKPASENTGPGLWALIKSKLNSAAPLEKEDEITMDDNFDGIRELDNKVPLWFNILFYGTIVFAVIYMLDYHVFRSSKLMIDEYQEEVASAELQKEILMRSGKFVTEDNVTLLTDMGALNNGKSIFESKCSVCHGKAGEGIVGPNLTDDYWINGGGIKNIFKVVKYGVPARGMLTWQNQLSPQEIQEVASFVYSLHGSNPTNGKQPEGEKYNETKDSLQVSL